MRQLCRPIQDQPAVSGYAYSLCRRSAIAMTANADRRSDRALCIPKEWEHIPFLLDNIVLCDREKPSGQINPVVCQAGNRRLFKQGSKFQRLVVLSSQFGGQCSVLGG